MGHPGQQNMHSYQITNQLSPPSTQTKNINFNNTGEHSQITIKQTGHNSPMTQRLISQTYSSNIHTANTLFIKIILQADKHNI